jgi:predicted phage baseplate assembly protein
LALEGRSLLLHKQGMEPLQLAVTSKRQHFENALSKRDTTHPWLWPIALDKALEGFSPLDFEEENPKVRVYGNLVEANQGRAEREALLGDGDSRQAFQTFRLPKSPLTYLRSEEDTPPWAPELEVFVDDRRWQRVASLFGRGPNEEIYIVREDAEGNSWVQFGDGRTGARLPSGRQNVTARYRSGTGAYGPLKEGATAQGGAPLKRLDKILLPGIAAGGEPPESGDNARAAAPGRARGLSRLVGLDDFESEARAAPGVAKAAARWALYLGVPSVVVTALMERGREEEFGNLQEILIEADQGRGPGRFPIRVSPGIRQYVYLELTVGRDPALRKSLVEKAVKEALGLSGAEGDGIDGSEGLFSAPRRKFGQPEYANRIEGVVQNVEGVLWARVDAFLALACDSDDPQELTLPDVSVRNASVLCYPDLLAQADQVLLCLHAAHFRLIPSVADSTEVPGDD